MAKKTINEAPPGLVGSALGAVGRMAWNGVKKGANAVANSSAGMNVKKAAFADFLAREWKRYASHQDLQPTPDNLEDFIKAKWGVDLTYPGTPEKKAPRPREQGAQPAQDSQSAAPVQATEPPKAAEKPAAKQPSPELLNMVDDTFSMAGKLRHAELKKQGKIKKRQPHPALDPRYGISKNRKTKEGLETLDKPLHMYESFSDILAEMRVNEDEVENPLSNKEVMGYFANVVTALMRRSDVDEASRNAMPGTEKWIKYLAYIQKNGGVPNFAQQGQQAQQQQQKPATPSEPTGQAVSINWTVMASAMKMAKIDQQQMKRFIETAREGDMHDLMRDIQKHASDDEAKRVMAAIIMAYSKAFPA